MVETKVKEALDANNRELLRNIGSMINKISVPTLHDKTKEQTLFKRKRNEEQYKVNSKVLSKLEDSAQSLENGNMATAKDSILEGNLLVVIE